MSYKIYKDHIFKNDTLLSNEYIVNELNDLDYYKQEIERLNNIIKVLNGMIDTHLYAYKHNCSVEYELARGQLQLVKDKLEELKNSSNEEIESYFVKEK